MLAIAVKHLVALGMAGDALAAAVAEMQAADDHRSSGAKRQQRYRDKRNEASQSVTSDVSDVCPAPLIPPSPSPAPLPLPPYNPPSPVSDAEASSPVLRPEHVVDAWNEMAGRIGLPKVRGKLSEARRRTLIARIRGHPLDEWMDALNAIERAKWMHGDNDRGWRADFDFLLQPKSFQRLIEGSYDREQ